MLKLADESDLEIVCGEHNIGGLPEQISRETEVILKIERIINHPEYTKENGPINGYDISVYLVDDAPLKQLLHPDTNRLDPFRIYPVCLPRALESDYLSEKGILTGWRDPRPHYFSQRKEDQFQYRRVNLLIRHVQMERVPCADPNWMNSTTYYPQGLLVSDLHLI